MEGFPIEPDRFDFSFPLWTVAQAKVGPTPRIVPIADPNIEFAIGKTQQGVFLVLLTDEDLGVRFAKAVKLRDPTLMRLVGPGDTIRFLEEIERRGFHHFAFDPTPGGKSVTVYLITELLDVLRKLP